MSLQIGALIAALSLVVSYLAYSLSKQKESKTEIRQDTEIREKLNSIGKGVDDIRIDLKSNERQMASFGERITRVEESTKQAHKRIDTIENKNEN